MAVHEWIDQIAKNFEISDGKGGTVRSYRAYEKNEFPETIAVPCALSYVVGVTNQYSLGGPCVDMYEGVTEFHVTAGVSKTHLPYVMGFFARIRDAAAGDITLGGTVSWWLLRQDEQSIVGPVTLQYGSEEPHHGLIVRWQVKENVSGDFTVSA